MNIICIRIDDPLDAAQIKDLKADLAHLPHVSNVEMLATLPHELMVEYEEHHNVPIRLLSRLSRQGLHSDVQYC